LMKDLVTAMQPLARAAAMLLILGGCARPVPQRLAGPRDGVSVPYGLAQDATCLYWTERGNGGAIRRMPKTGGTVETLWRGVSPYGWFCAVDDRFVYWTEFDAGTLRRVGKSGGRAVTLARGLGNPGQLCLAHGFVWWVEYSGNVICRLRVTGGRPETVVAGLAGPQAIAVDDQAVYWTEFSDPPVLKRRRLTGGPVLTIATTKPECWLVFAGGWLWWTETRGFVRRVRRSGGSVEDLAPIPPSGAFAGTDGRCFYWSEEHGGLLKRLPLTGQGTPEVLLRHLKHPAVMVVDRKAVYWTDPEQSTISRFPIP